MDKGVGQGMALLTGMLRMSTWSLCNSHRCCSHQLSFKIFPYLNSRETVLLQQ